MQNIKKITSFLGQYYKPFIIALIIALYGWNLRPLRQLDSWWSDNILASNPVVTSSEYVVIPVGQSDLIALNRPIIDRVIISQGLENLNKVQPKRVFLDFLFSGANIADNDRKLAMSFDAFGYQNIGFGMDVDPALSPPKYFADRATRSFTRFYPSKDGYFREVLTKNNYNMPNPAIWIASGNTINTNLPIDVRINPLKVKTFKFVDLVNNVNVESLRGKKIIISFDRKLSTTRLLVPIYGEIDRATYLAIAAMSYENSFQFTKMRTDNINLLIVIIAFLSGYFIGALAHSIKVSSIAFTCMASIIVIVSLQVLKEIGGPTTPGSAIFEGIIGMYVALAHRLKLYDLFANFMAGNLSPEEAFLWRSKSDQKTPVILFDAVGGIKKINDSAQDIFNLKEIGKKKPTLEQLEKNREFARKCIPNFGERSQNLKITDRNSTFWEIEWPHSNIQIAVFSDVTEQINKETALRKKLVTDPLTGLYNRSGFEMELNKIDEEQRHDYALFFMDMNGFKAVNDTYGHDAGDELLNVVGKRLTSILRDGDVLARLGGDEFVVIINGKMHEQLCQNIATKMEATLDAPINLKNARVKVGLAVGYSYPLKRDDTTAVVIARADKAMYARKAILKGPNAQNRA